MSTSAPRNRLADASVRTVRAYVGGEVVRQLLHGPGPASANSAASAARAPAAADSDPAPANSAHLTGSTVS
jgi:hypothetical protein